MNLVSSPPPIAVITDFGDLDPFVGIMKGVIASIAPEVHVIDITHNIPPGDIKRAAVVLWQSKPYFPIGTVFLLVVDPGVGSNRRGIIAREDGRVYIGPDNGIFTLALESSASAWELQNSKYKIPAVSSTFHGRDVFAPAAAFAAQGVPGSEFGPRVQKLVEIRRPALSLDQDQIIGEILFSDHFGNLLSSIGSFVYRDGVNFSLQPWIKYTNVPNKKVINFSRSRLLIPGGDALAWFETFAKIPAGECGFLLGSSGLLEIAANQGSADDILRISEGDSVALRF